MRIQGSDDVNKQKLSYLEIIMFAGIFAVVAAIAIYGLVIAIAVISLAMSYFPVPTTLGLLVIFTPFCWWGVRKFRNRHHTASC